MTHYYVGYFWWCDETNNEIFHFLPPCKTAQEASLLREEKQQRLPGRSWRVADENEMLLWKQQGKNPKYN